MLSDSHQQPQFTQPHFSTQQFVPQQQFIPQQHQMPVQPTLQQAPAQQGYQQYAQHSPVQAPQQMFASGSVPAVADDGSRLLSQLQQAQLRIQFLETENQSVKADNEHMQHKVKTSEEELTELRDFRRSTRERVQEMQQEYETMSTRAAQFEEEANRLREELRKSQQEHQLTYEQLRAQQTTNGSTVCEIVALIAVYRKASGFPHRNTV